MSPSMTSAIPRQGSNGAGSSLRRARSVDVNVNVHVGHVGAGVVAYARGRLGVALSRPRSRRWRRGRLQTCLDRQATCAVGRWIQLRELVRTLVGECVSRARAAARRFSVGSESIGKRGWQRTLAPGRALDAAAATRVGEGGSDAGAGTPTRPASRTRAGLQARKWRRR